ncbi:MULTISPECIES: LysR substrate-binding domain-containing protein [Arthrobacter]|uniref:LysR family transcriptional regulator n=1 Tax=Arthrobacter terricola TaxID=2547396 RepID=A0A4R5K6P9_9MICC|nr:MULTISPECIES: LysR substrate-binding domain-containing protein [Arthrobacter]MBT8162221.1 LysR family transcriptional regulator [Arthrobacter sp. GN70]TDF89158.1 LysR family transcriptional regulator [Arthrobacter terricola]
MDVTLAQLRYFVEAAAQLSMTGAAIRLNVAQSAISAAVSQLEKSVGSQFFIRQRSKGLLLTPAGELFLRDAQAVLGQLEEALDHARGEQRSVEGQVRLACFSTLAPFLLPGLLGRLRADHPRLELEVTEADAEGCSTALLTGRADLALCYDLGLPDGIAVTAVDSVRPYLALPPGHKFAGREEVALSELAGEPFVLLDLPHSRELMLSILRDAGVEPDVRFRSASYETVRTFVAGGHGYSILHQRPRHGLTYDGGHVAAVGIKDRVPELSIVLARLRTQRPTARMRAVAQALRHHKAATQEPGESLPA